jgi:hypothetical protein
MPGLLAPLRSIFTHSFTTRIPDPCGYEPDAESGVKFKISCKVLQNGRLKHQKIAFFTFFLMRIRIRNKEFLCL